MQYIPDTSKNSAIFNQAVLDALDSHIAVLSENGDIVAVNAAWERYGSKNGATHSTRVGIGMNYLEVCQKVSDHSAPEAHAALKGIRSVLDGKQPFFEMEYPCHATETKRWFLMRVSAMPGRIGGAVVSHIDISERKSAERSLRQKNFDLGERVKELNCLYELSNIFQKPDISLEDTLHTIVDIIPKSWQYPDVAGARIRLENREYRTSNFTETPWQQSSGIVTDNGLTGTIEVMYLQEKPEEYEGPFLREERELIDEIGKRLGMFIGHKQKDQEIRKLSIAVEQCTSGINMTDMNGVIVHVNRASAAMYGYDPEALIGKHVQILNMDSKFVTSQIIPTVQKDGFWSGELTQKKRDGSLFTALLTLSIVKIDEQPIGMIGVVHDITEKKKIEASLRDHRQLLSSILESTADGILVGHADGSFSFANQRFANMWHIPQDVIDRKDRAELHRQILHQLKDPEGFKEALQRLYRTADKHLDTIEFKDGRLFERYSEPLFRNGEISGRIWSFRDITGRKQAEEALRESESRFRQLTEMLPETIFEMDVNGTLTYANRKAFDHFRYDREDFERGLSAFDMVVPEERDKAINNMTTIMKGLDLGLTEYTALRKDGTTFEAMFRSAPIIRQGKPAGLRGFIIDVSKQKQAENDKQKLEQLLMQAQRMEAIGTLAGGIAHDFNNILGAIIGYTELALFDITESSPARTNLNQVVKAVNRAKDLVSQILAFSRQSKETDRPVRIGPLVKEVLKLLRATLPATIEIQQDLELESGAVVIDPSQIHRIIMNLCTNAAHAMQDSTAGRLKVALSESIVAPEDGVLLGDLAPGPYVKITVSDTGHGIAPEIRSQIFDPYFTTKKKGVGTGLGLSVVYGIVQSHGGEIEVISEPGKGSTFNIYLPFVKELAQSELMPVEVFPLGNEHILFIDDEEALVQIGTQMLERLGYRVTARLNPLEGLEAFKANSDRFDLVISDQTMPNMTGEKLARQLMQIKPDIPIILCSGFSEVMDETRAESAGIRAYIMKPLLMGDLATTVRNVLDAKNIEND